MEAMVNRWKDKLTAIEQKQKPTAMSASTLSAHPPRPEQSHESEPVISLKKSVDKNKKSLQTLHSEQRNQLQSQQVLSSKRLTTPTKSKSKAKTKSNRNSLIQKCCQDIIQLFAQISPSQKNLPFKLKSILQHLCIEAVSMEPSSPRNTQVNYQMESSLLMKQSQASSSSASKRQQRLYQDLQKKYFDSQKEKHYLKSKVDEIVKKYENVQRQLQKYGKMEKLIDNCLLREQEAREQVKRLKQQLQIAEIKEVEQQRIFQQQINIVRELVDEIRKNLPST